MSLLPFFSAILLRSIKTPIHEEFTGIIQTCSAENRKHTP
jgi:hypothetical protein